MDYELFLLFRIQREYLLGRDNDRATVAGLVAVAPVITGAGLIMAVVFGAFVTARLPVLKMIGCRPLRGRTDRRDADPHLRRSRRDGSRRAAQLVSRTASRPLAGAKHRQPAFPSVT